MSVCVLTRTPIIFHSVDSSVDCKPDRTTGCWGTWNYVCSWFSKQDWRVLWEITSEICADQYIHCSSLLCSTRPLYQSRSWNSNLVSFVRNFQLSTFDISHSRCLGGQWTIAEYTGRSFQSYWKDRSWKSSHSYWMDKSWKSSHSYWKDKSSDSYC